VQPKSLYGTNDSKRRLDEDSNEPYRGPYRMDYARLIHSPAFRRLQGKTQLFPGADSDYFRNRLTHSIEVSQIAESICYKINYENDQLKNDPVDSKIAVIAGLAHDLGHPPFGHNGESALDDCMKDCGGFEGNAQSLRIISTLEKKRIGINAQFLECIDDDGVDQRLGLNLTYRVVASILKYDKEIETYRNPETSLSKGYYGTDSEFVREVKEAVCGKNIKNFKTIECHIMDVADDIAYSTYDIDDAFKGGFLSPLDIISSSPNLIDRVAKRVSERLGYTVTDFDVVKALSDLFEGTLFVEAAEGSGSVEKSLQYLSISTYAISKNTANNGYLRTQLTSELIFRFINGIKFEWNADCPALSRVYLDDETRLLVEVLKVFSFEATIMSPRLRIIEARGYDIITTIFKTLEKADGNLLLPDDFRAIYQSMPSDQGKKRVICDFIAGMTDKYAVEFYGRLTGETHRSIFTPF
jgi:dGTPase